MQLLKVSRNFRPETKNNANSTSNQVRALGRPPQMDISWTIFALTGLLALVISLLTVGLSGLARGVNKSDKEFEDGLVWAIALAKPPRLIFFDFGVSNGHLHGLTSENVMTPRMNHNF